MIGASRVPVARVRCTLRFLRLRGLILGRSDGGLILEPVRKAPAAVTLDAMAANPRSPREPASKDSSDVPMPASAPALLPGGDVAPWRTVTGPVRPGRRTKLLVKHLSRGDIALIDHLDIDRVSAEELIAADVGAVLNCRPSSSGSYPNLGPQLLVEAGIHLVDLPDDSLLHVLSDGEAITVRDGEVTREGEVLARGEVLDLARVRAETEARRREVGEALERFAHNTIEHMREERELLAGKIEMPRFATDFRDRSALVVVRGVGHQRDLRALRPFIRDMRPVLIAVDGGAEALLEEGLRPDMIVGDMDSAGEAALMSSSGGRGGWGSARWGSAKASGGAELVVHAYPDGRAPGRERLEALGLPFKLVPAPGTSQDVAMLIAAEKGASLIVSVGSQFNLVEFLDRNRKGMSSTFLTRLRIGEILVDAKGVSRLYHPRPGLTPLLVVIAAGLIAMIAVVWLTPALRDVVDLLWLKLQLLLGGDACSAGARPMFDYPLPRALAGRRPVRPGGGRADRRGDRRLEPRLLRQERDRAQPRIGSRAARSDMPKHCRRS